MIFPRQGLERCRKANKKGLEFTLIIEVFEMTLKNLVVSRASTTVTAPAFFTRKARPLRKQGYKKFKIPLEKCKIYCIFP